MTGKFVYVLSDHGEDGAENMDATLDRSCLVWMVAQNWADCDASWIERTQGGLLPWLEKSDEELATEDGCACGEGWGGMQLHVVELV